MKRWDLRWPVTESVSELEGRTFLGVSRRSKYLLLAVDDGSTLLIHLGMSGSLRVVEPGEDWKKHDHFALTLSTGKQLRFHDPRRFGVIFHLKLADPFEHPLLAKLGPEPLGDDFTGAYLKSACKARKSAIKQVVMDGKVVVGVGNIYASEALFRARILPQSMANQLSKPKLDRLVKSIREVLIDSIVAGGTTLRDFLRSDGQPGYFRQKLFVYERKGQPCLVCGSEIQHAMQGQRSTYWCPKCQK